MARAQIEGDSEIGAGLLALDTNAESPAPHHGEEAQIAFGRFVRLMRRKKELSVEELAATADVDLGELVSIEDDAHHKPEPRTVYQLARAFDVPNTKLSQLAGLAIAKDVRFKQEAMRFAARSEPIEKLTPEENAALESFIMVLSDKSEPGDKAR
ncbi:MAG: helix-turn-helix transcriptional regulator [Rhodospirillales bacterium]|nr:helix-turn-helix transcriptional regulator [Rhodospirillales bacterium]